MTLALATQPQRPSSALINSVEDIYQIAESLSKSGYFRDAKDVHQCAVKVLAGKEMGFGAFASMKGIHIIQGTPSVGANLMATAVKASGRYNYRTREISKDVCRIEFFERWDGKWESIGFSEMTMVEAKAANLHMEWDKDKSQWREKHNWKTYPANMLFARAMSNGVKWYCPDVLGGCTVYDPDELGVEVNEDGEPVNVPVTVVESKPLPAAPAAPEIHPNAAKINALFRELGVTTKAQKYKIGAAVLGDRAAKDLTEEELAKVLDQIRTAVEDDAS